MKLGILTQQQPVHREIWRSLDPMARLVLLANGQVAIDDDGLPRVADEVLATTLRDIEGALGLR